MGQISIEDLEKDISKINRTLTRLKYSIQADRELREQARQTKELLKQGVLPQLEASLSELLDQS